MGRGTALGMTWADFKHITYEKFCPEHEIERLKLEFSNLAMVGADHSGYTRRFHELARLVPHLVTPESIKISKYVNG